MPDGPLTLVPARTPGLVADRLDDLAVVYDPVPSVVHVLGPGGTEIWNRAPCSGVAPAPPGAPPDAVTALVSAGLLGGSDWISARDDAPEPPPARHLSGRFEVLDTVVDLSADDPGLIRAAEGLLAPLATTRPATTHRSMTSDGTHTVLRGPRGEHRYPSATALLEDLPSEMNRLAARARGMVALHAAGVVSPGGGVVVLAGPSGSGKSTLAGALLRAGWGYLSDEAVGIRPEQLAPVAYPKPLSLDSESRRLLGIASGDRYVPASRLTPDPSRPGVGAVTGITAVLLLGGSPGPAATAGPLEPPDALAALAPHAFNLRADPHAGLAALVGVARAVPVHSLPRGPLDDAVAAVVGLVSH